MAFSKRYLVAVAALMGGIAVVAPGCSSAGPGGSNPSSSDSTGTVGLNLTTGGETLNAVVMNITQGAVTVVTKTINVSSTNATISAFVGALPAGAYHVHFSANATSGDACTGDADFTVTAGVDGSVTVPVVCGGVNPTSATGGEYINGQVTGKTTCPALTAILVAPLQVGVGDSLDISAAAAPAGGTIAWTATDGSFDSAFTKYTCTSPGAKVLTVKVTDSAISPTCLSQHAINVTCAGAAIDAGSGSGGATGSGGTTSSGGTTASGGTTTASGGTTTASGGTTGSGGTTSVDPNALICSTTTTTGAPGGKTLVANPTACTQCENDSGCDPTAIAGCSIFTSATDQAACNAVLECVRQTGCLVNTSVDCYCGLGADTAVCQASLANATGPCAAAIKAANPTFTSAQNFGALQDVSNPAGNPLNLVQCDVNNCGDPAFGGSNQCTPFCSP